MQVSFSFPLLSSLLSSRLRREEAELRDDEDEVLFFRQTGVVAPRSRACVCSSLHGWKGDKYKREERGEKLSLRGDDGERRGRVVISLSHLKTAATPAPSKLLHSTYPHSQSRLTWFQQGVDTDPTAGLVPPVHFQGKPKPQYIIVKAQLSRKVNK